MCKTQLTELENLEPFKGQEIAVGGHGRERAEPDDQNRQAWGKFVLEDYNGTHEFALFSKDYENFRKYLFNDYFLFIRGKVQPKPTTTRSWNSRLLRWYSSPKCATR